VPRTSGKAISSGKNSTLLFKQLLNHKLGLIHTQKVKTVEHKFEENEDSFSRIWKIEGSKDFS
jgi:hypothetical protein